MVRKATRADRAAVIATLAAAFANDAIIRYQFADDDTYPLRAAAFFGHYFDVRLEGGEIFVAGDLSGAALWSPPGGNRLGAEFVKRHWNETVVPAIAPDELGRYESFKKVLDAVTPEGPHWYLGLLGTRPDKRRTGVGRALFQPMIERADGEGLPIFLETGMPGNVEIYERFGFAVIAEDQVPGGPTVWGMIRAPR